MQREAGHRHRRMLRHDDEQPAERGQHAADPYRAHRAEAVHHPVAREPGDRHGQREAGGGRRREPGRGVQHVPQIDRRPVQARALREHRAEPDRADEQRRPGRQREPRRRLLVLGGPQIQYALAGDQPEQR